MNYTELSKEVSYALRHSPQEYGLVLDDNGWVYIEDLLIALRKKKKWSKVDGIDLVKMIEVSNKKRHETVDDKIRALYGHSTNKTIKKEKVEPSEYLYHGTARRFLEAIKKDGLTPMQRQYVHLSEDEDTAYVVGKRRDDKPVMLKVKAKLAWTEGISFYMGNENIWLSDTIPSQYIIFS
jgi:putative RNA 2'-phosphotransferase